MVALYICSGVTELAILFQDSFDDATTNKWDLIVQPTFVSFITAPVHSGAYALHIANTEGYGTVILKNFTATQKINAQAYVKFDSITPSVASGGVSCFTQILTINGASKELAIVQLNAYQGNFFWIVAVYDALGNHLYGSSFQVVIDFNHYYSIKGEFDSTSNTLKLYVDGVLVDTVSSGSASSELPSKLVLNNWTSGVAVLNYDDVSVESVAVIPTCPTGYHWDANVNACVQDAQPPSAEFPWVPIVAVVGAGLVVGYLILK